MDIENMDPEKIAAIEADMEATMSTLWHVAAAQNASFTEHSGEPAVPPVAWADLTNPERMAWGLGITQAIGQLTVMQEYVATQHTTQSN